MFKLNLLLITFRQTLMALIFCSLASAAFSEDSAITSASQTTSNTSLPIAIIEVDIETSSGTIRVALNNEKAPISVKNFLSYVEEGFYENIIFHRVIDRFMIQTGGFDTQLNRKETRDPIKNEAENGLKNLRGTIAMARTGIVDSATSQFFINLADNRFLDNGVRGFGYAVFGKVIQGMDVVSRIGQAKTTRRGILPTVPAEEITILSIKVIGDTRSSTATPSKSIPPKSTPPAVAPTTPTGVKVN